MPKNTDQKQYSQQDKTKANVLASWLTGVGSAVIFHPLDRAIYLSTSTGRKIYKSENFARPFQGLTQTISYKQFTNSTYYIIQGELQQRLLPILNSANFSDNSKNICTGIIAGTIDGAIGNTPAAIRENGWTSGRSFTESVSRMWQDGGIKPFTNGVYATMMRNAGFGAIYEVTRLGIRSHIDKQHKLSTDIICDAIGAGTAVIATSPINYARIMQHRVAPGTTPPSIKTSVLSLFRNTVAQPTFLGKLGFFQQSTNIGASTIRAAGAMALTQFSVDRLRENLSVVIK